MRKKILVLLLMVLVTVLAVSGCTKAVKQEAISFADRATEDYLISINNQDYESYKKDLGGEMLEVVPEEEFIKFSSYLKSTIGDYIADSKEISGSSIQNELILIVYGASYTEETGEVTVTMVISEPEEGNYKIVGSWFDSPKLRENEYE